MSDDRRDDSREPDLPEEERSGEAGSPGEAGFPEEAGSTEEVFAEDLTPEETPAEEPTPEAAAVDEADEPLSTDPSDPSEIPEVEADLSPLVAELVAARRERDDYLDGLRRLKAEFENSRKRMERERERILQTASERLVSQLLPVLDNLERALEAEGDVREGVSATRDQLVEVLEREGLAAIDSDGEPFDPAVHEAVMGQPSDEHEDGTILQTFERGYVLNGRAIRPAKVVVARQG